MITIKYDKPFEVTESQYNKLMDKCSGLVAGRQVEGRYFIKVWAMKYIDYIKQVGNL